MVAADRNPARDDAFLDDGIGSDDGAGPDDGILDPGIFPDDGSRCNRDHPLEDGSRKNSRLRMNRNRPTRFGQIGRE
jgi:hypothetical protein